MYSKHDKVHINMTFYAKTIEISQTALSIAAAYPFDYTAKIYVIL